MKNINRSSKAMKCCVKICIKQCNALSNEEMHYKINNIYINVIVALIVIRINQLCVHTCECEHLLASGQYLNNESVLKTHYCIENWSN